MTEGLGLVVVGAGSSDRMLGVDKIWAPIASHPVVWHSLTRLAPKCDHVVLVMRNGMVTEASERLGAVLPGLRIVGGGATRQASVWEGLQAMQGVRLVAIHDAARPLATSTLLDRGVDLLSLCDGAVPVVPIMDTIKRVDRYGAVVSTLEREHLFSTQTPQVFHLEILKEAYEAASADGFAGTDDASLVERAGRRVLTFPGDARNLKVTTREDLRLASALLSLSPEH